MSQGIRAGLEVRPEGEKRWIAVVPSVDVDEVSNRTVFTLLAGHPSTLGVQPVVPVRGLPDDLSSPIRTLHDRWHGAASEASWVTLDELSDTLQQLTTRIAELSTQAGIPTADFMRQHRGVSMDAVIAFLGVYQSHGFDVRLVFWSTPI